MTQGGLPHSEIAGSKLVCSSPALIAAYRVLHRLLAPRHSPYALSSLTMNMRARMLNHQLGLAPQPVTDHPTAVPSFKTLLLCRSCRGRKLPFAGYSVVKEPVRL